LGLFGWREKRGFMSPLPQSPLGRPLFPWAGKEVMIWLWYSKAFFRPENLIYPDFLRKQGNKVIRIRKD
jgi:hypothetical protein